MDVVQQRNSLHQAAKNGEVEVLRVLLCLRDNVVLVNRKDKHGNLPLHFAVAHKKRNKAAQMTEMLLQAGSSVEMENDKRLNAIGLCILVCKDEVDVLMLLLKYGVHARIQGLSALSFAVENGLDAVACVLVEHGADISMESQLVSTVVSQRVLRMLIRHIRYAPRFMNIYEVNHCMKCNHGPFRDARRKVSGIQLVFRKVCKSTVLVDYGNCYYCGLIFCTDCLKTPLNEVALPKTFHRDGKTIQSVSSLSAFALEPTSPHKVCTICANVLEQRMKQTKSSTYFMSKFLGYQS